MEAGWYTLSLFISETYELIQMLQIDSILVVQIQLYKSSAHERELFN